jgi:hypothetical protein
MVGMSLIANQKDMARRYEAQIRELQDNLERMSLALAVEQSNVAGLQAQVDKFKESHPDSILLHPTSHRFKDGQGKPIARVIFELAFDANLKGLGVSNPAQYQLD